MDEHKGEAGESKQRVDAEPHLQALGATGRVDRYGGGSESEQKGKERKKCVRL